MLYCIIHTIISNIASILFDNIDSDRGLASPRLASPPDLFHSMHKITLSIAAVAKCSRYRCPVNQFALPFGAISLLKNAYVPRLFKQEEEKEKNRQSKVCGGIRT